MKNPDAIKVLVADDHSVVRMGIAAMIQLEPDMTIVAEAEDGQQALEQYKTFHPDVTLMDLLMPGISGVEAITAIRETSPDARIIVLSTYEGDDNIYQAIHAGAYGYLLKRMPGEEVVNAIRAVHAGRYYIPAPIAARLASRVPRSDLTPRELEVLKLLAKGQSNKEIALALNITEGTVKAHVLNILGKLGVDDRTGATTTALRRGIIQLD